MQYRNVPGKKVSARFPVIPTAAVLVTVLIAGSLMFIAHSQTHSVTVAAPDRTLRLISTARTVEDLLKQVNVRLGTGDQVLPSLESEIQDGMTVTLMWARPVFVSCNGTIRTILTSSDSVDEALKEAAIGVDKDDSVLPGLGEKIPESGLVKVVKVTYGQVTESVSLAFPVERRDDTSLEAGLTRVYTKGQNGVAQVTYDVRYEDGREVSRKEVSRTVVKEPTKQVILVGRMREVSRGGENIRFQRALEVTATAYCPCPICCGKYANGITYLGVPAKKGVIAVDPRVIPLGTRVYVDGYGFALAADTGSAIKGNRIDVCFDTHQEALNFGRKTLKVYVLE